jgi:small subunit ribosomal protein S1
MTTSEDKKTAKTSPEAEQTMESLLAEQSEMHDKLQKRDVVWVKVVQAGKETVLVDIGEKSEGVIPAEEFNGQLPQAGKRVPAVLIKRGRGDQPAMLSTKRAKAAIGWDTIAKSFEAKERLKGRVTSAVKGGFLVDISGVAGFMPSSLADIRPVRKPDQLVGTGVKCYIIELNKEKNQLIVSRRAVLEEDQKKRRDKLIGELKPGRVRIGRINRVNESGLFVDIGGAEGLVLLEDLAWKDPEKAKEKFTRGQKLRVRVLKIDKDSGKISLGVKQLQPHPADALKKKYPVKGIVKGTVEAVEKDGVKIKLTKGDLAFCPVFELPAEGGDPFEKKPRRDDNQPRIWPKAGEEISGIVLGVDMKTVTVRVSIRRFDQIQDRKQVQRYMKAAPKLTLGDLLNPDAE